jgi:hypothetical protein
MDPNVSVLYPRLVLAELAALGEGGAELVVPRHRRFPSALIDVEGASSVQLRIYSLVPPGGDIPVPDALGASATEWVRGDALPDPVHTLVDVVSLALADDQIDAVVDARGSGIIQLMKGDPNKVARHAELSFGGLLLGAGGRAANPTDLERLAREQISVARSLAETSAWSFVDFSSRFEMFHSRHEPSDPDRASLSALAHLPDFAVYDASPYHVLSSDHVDRLESSIRRRCNRLSGDRWELVIGELADWMPGSAVRDERLQEGRAALAPLLKTMDEVFAEIRRRRDRMADP